MALLVCKQIPSAGFDLDFRTDRRIQRSSATFRPRWLRGFVAHLGVWSATRAAPRSSRTLRPLEAVIEQSGQCIEPLTWIRWRDPRFGIHLQFRNFDGWPLGFSY